VLLRAGDIIEGIDLARHRRPAARVDRDLARGPARLTQALGLTGADDGTDLLDAAGRAQLLTGTAVQDICHGPRVGVGAATEVPWRFWERGAASVSPFRPGRPRPASSSARH
jgi:DNA-3-methyladenine glycosylase